MTVDERELLIEKLYIKLNELLDNPLRGPNANLSYDFGLITALSLAKPAQNHLLLKMKERYLNN